MNTINEKLIKIISLLETLTLVEAVELVKSVEHTFGVIEISITPISRHPIAKIAPIELIEEKTNFNIILTEVPADKKIAILKIIRNITGLGLKESKDIVDNIPKTIKENITKNEVEIIRKELETAGAKIIVQ